MIWKGNGIIKFEEGEPAFRSCWECNSAHEHLKTVNWLHVCFNCGRYWVYDRFLDAFETTEEFDAFFAGKGLGPGDSTTKVDAGYRVVAFEMDMDDGSQDTL